MNEGEREPSQSEPIWILEKILTFYLVFITKNSIKKRFILILYRYTFNYLINVIIKQDGINHPVFLVLLGNKF